MLIVRSGIQDSYRTLGWTRSQWDDGSGTPSSENKDWDELTCNEKKAADFVCFFKENWETESLTAWGGMTQPASPSCGTGGGNEEVECFSAANTVEVQGKGITRMDELEIGDKVSIGDGSYSEVFSFGHFAPNQLVSYLRIKVETIDHPLEISKNHLIYKYDQSKKHQSIVAVRYVKIGDFLITDKELPVQVLSIKELRRQGAYAPITVAGNMLVNGILASNYVDREWMPERVSGQTMHIIQHGGLVWYRMYCSWIGCQDETYDSRNGFSQWVNFGFQVEDWIHHLNPAVRALVLILAILPVLLFDYCMGSFLISPFLFMAHATPFMFAYISWTTAKNSLKASDTMETSS